MRFLNFTLFLFILIIFPVSVMAQGHSIFCSQADSTAASQKCLKKHLDSAQKRLNKVYKELGSKLEGEKLTELKDLQNTWLQYRDAECMWESQGSATPSLKRVNELSCMARVTDDRADLLTVIYMDGDSELPQREYGSFPRWMNVLAKDYPDVFWNYGQRTSADLNCDGEDEHVMSGVQISLVKSDNDDDIGEPVKSMYENHIVLAVAQNPPTGRPKADVIKFSVQKNGANDTVCSDNVSAQFGKKIIEETISEEDEDEAQQKTCLDFIQLNNKGCDPKVISWTGKDFALEVEEIAEEENKKESK